MAMYTDSVLRACCTGHADMLAKPACRILSYNAEFELKEILTSNEISSCELTGQMVAYRNVCVSIVLS